MFVFFVLYPYPGKEGGIHLHSIDNIIAEDVVVNTLFCKNAEWLSWKRYILLFRWSRVRSHC